MTTVETSRLIEMAKFITSWTTKNHPDFLLVLNSISVRNCPFCSISASTNLSLLQEENLYTITCNICNCLGPEDHDLLTALKLRNGQG